MADFLFDSSGDWIAWRRTTDDRFLFNDDGDAIGWFPWSDADAVYMDGKYLGTVVGNRLLRKEDQPYRGYPGYPGYPATPDTRATPPTRGTSRPPPGSPTSPRASSRADAPTAQVAAASHQPRRTQ